MFDLLIIGQLHAKNRNGLDLLLTKNNIKYKYGSKNDINDYQNIYCPSGVIDPSMYKTKKIAFGPHFSTFPNNNILKINNTNNNSVVPKDIFNFKLYKTD